MCPFSQGILDPNSLPVPAVGGDRFPANNALHLPPDCRGCSWKFWLAEPGTQHQPDLHRTAGEKTKVQDLWWGYAIASFRHTLKMKHRAKMYFVELCYQI